MQALTPYADLVMRVCNEDGKDPYLQHEPGSHNPPEHVKLTWEWWQLLWNPIDADGDGQLSKHEIYSAIAQGLVTERIVTSLDLDGDGIISKAEMLKAHEQRMQAASKAYK